MKNIAQDIGASDKSIFIGKGFSLSILKLVLLVGTMLFKNIRLKSRDPPYVGNLLLCLAIGYFHSR